jgi:hypothetical protein
VRLSLIKVFGGWIQIETISQPFRECYVPAKNYPSDNYPSFILDATDEQSVAQEKNIFFKKYR